jgi:hypothetical protein
MEKDEVTAQPDPEIEEVEIEAEPSGGEDEAALKAAIATIAAAQMHPMQLAIDNAELRESLKGAYVLLRALMTDKVGVNTAYVVAREAWMAADPNERLQIDRNERGDAVLTIIRRSRAQRRASKTTKPR